MRLQAQKMKQPATQENLAQNDFGQKRTDIRTIRADQREVESGILMLLMRNGYFYTAISLLEIPYQTDETDIKDKVVYILYLLLLLLD